MNGGRSPYGPLLADAARVPFRDRENARRVILGGLLCLVPILNFVAWGYAYRVFIQGLNGAPALVLPTWQDWRSYIRVGAWLFLIVATYVVLLTFGIAGLAGLFGSSLESPEQVHSAAEVAFALFNVFSAVALARFASEGRVWAAFEPDAIWHGLRRVIGPDYVQLLCVACALWLAAKILVTSPVLFPVATVIQFYAMTVVGHVLGRLVGDRLADEASREDGEAE